MNEKDTKEISIDIHSLTSNHRSNQRTIHRNVLLNFVREKREEKKTQ